GEFGRLEDGQRRQVVDDLGQISHFLVPSGSNQIFSCLACSTCGLRGRCVFRRLPYQAASPALAFAWITRASCAPGSLTVRAIFVAGEDSRPSSLALSSSREGNSASALTAFASRTVFPIAPPRITSLSFSLAYPTATF